jgi:hypothetical protein
MKTGPDALGTAENESMSANQENMTQRASYRQKRVRKCKTSKTGPDALGTAENEYGGAKHVNGSRRPRYREK